MLDAATNEYLTSTNPGTPVGNLFRRFWVPVLLSEELAEPDGPPQRIKILGEDLVLFRATDGRVGLLDAYCAHRGAPLFFGRNESCGLRCVYHGWKYDLSGACLETPNEPAQSRLKDHVSLISYPTVEAGGVIWAYMGPPGDIPPLPGLEWLSLDPSHCFLRRYLVESNYLQSLEGDHDPTHAGQLHSFVDGAVPDYQFGMPQFMDIQVKDKAPPFEVYDTDYGIVTVSRHGGSADTEFWRINPWLMPFYTLVPSEPGTPIVLNIRVPADDEHCWFIRIGYSPTEPISTRDREIWATSSTRFAHTISGTPLPVENLGNDYLIDRYRQRYETFTGILSVPAQDRAVQERMAPVPGKPGIVDRTREHLGSADVAIVRLRKRLLELAQGLEVGIEPGAARNPSVYCIRSPALELPRDVPGLEGAAPYISCATWERQVRAAPPASLAVS